MRRLIWIKYRRGPVLKHNEAGGDDAKSPSDGYTILATSSAFAVNVSLSPNAGYDPERDFAPIVQAGTQPNLIVVNASFPAKTLAELLEMAKTKKLAYASPGAGQADRSEAGVMRSNFAPGLRMPAMRERRPDYCPGP